MREYPHGIAAKVSDLQNEVSVDTYFTYGRDGAHDAYVATYDAGRHVYGVYHITREEPRAVLVQEFGSLEDNALDFYTERFRACAIERIY